MEQMLYLYQFFENCLLPMRHLFPIISKSHLGVKVEKQTCKGCRAMLQRAYVFLVLQGCPVFLSCRAGRCAQPAEQTI